MANLKPTNEEFSDSSYNNDPRLSQPSSGARQVRNVQTEKGYDPDKKRGSAKERASSTWGDSMQAGEEKAAAKKKREAQQTEQTNQAAGVRSVAATQYQTTGQGAAQSSGLVAAAGGKVRRKKKLGSPSVVGKLFGRSVTLSMWTWGFFIWMWFQVPFTIISIVFMAGTEAVYQVSVSATVSSADDGVVVTAAKGVMIFLNHTISAIGGLVKEVFGFGLDAFYPANVFMLTHVLLVFVGWGMLLTMGIIYTMTGQKAFSGKGAAGKNVMFILAFVGYAIPILNILPLFFFWTLMVWKNPR